MCKNAAPNLLIPGQALLRHKAVPYTIFTIRQTPKMAINGMTRVDFLLSLEKWHQSSAATISVIMGNDANPLFRHRATFGYIRGWLRKASWRRTLPGGQRGEGIFPVTQLVMEKAARCAFSPDQPIQGPVYMVKNSSRKATFVTLFSRLFCALAFSFYNYLQKYLSIFRGCFY